MCQCTILPDPSCLGVAWIVNTKFLYSFLRSPSIILILNRSHPLMWPGDALGIWCGLCEHVMELFSRSFDLHFYLKLPQQTRRFCHVFFLS
ncbi:hypothetical protein YC2023_022982 [Brassica napus]